MLTITRLPRPHFRLPRTTALHPLQLTQFQTKTALFSSESIITSSTPVTPIPTPNSKTQHQIDSTIAAIPRDLNGFLTPTLAHPLIYNPDDPLYWCQTFGVRNVTTTPSILPVPASASVAVPVSTPTTDGEESESESTPTPIPIPITSYNLKEGDAGYIDVSDITVPNVTIVTTVAQAKIVMQRLMDPTQNNNTTIYHACDTEVSNIDLSSVGPVGNGIVTCLSVYSGPDFSYGLNFDDDGNEMCGTTLWIDNLDLSAGVLQEFKPFLESQTIKKVWHNLGFDRHVLYNEGIDCLGFAGDTMHMARLDDTSRSKLSQGGGYGLEALTGSLCNGRAKKSMKELFGIPKKRKDGTLGNILEIPKIEEMQRSRLSRADFISYSAFDAEGTWMIHSVLKQRLIKRQWVQRMNLYDFYTMYLVPFGECLTDMERRGVRVNAKHYLADIERQARADKIHHSRTFRKWAAKIGGVQCLAMNPNSSTQMATFLFGGSSHPKRRDETTEEVRTFRVAREELEEDAIEAFKKLEDEKFNINRDINSDRDLHAYADADANANESGNELDKMTATQLKELLKENNLKTTGLKEELKERLSIFYLSGKEKPVVVTDDFELMDIKDLKDTCNARGLSNKGGAKALRKAIRADVLDAVMLLTEYANERDKGKGKGTDDEDEDGASDKMQFTKISEALNNSLSRGGDQSKLKEILDALNAKQKASKYVDLTIKSIYMTPTKFTASGAPSVTGDVLKKLAGDDLLGNRPTWGTAFEFFGGGRNGKDGSGVGSDQDGKEACLALHSLTQMGSIDTMISNFLVPLQSLSDNQGRVHCSLNLNTETGRLSARRPNLQNQPALEKDNYKIRKAFEASPGNKLIVADYGQLELRLLASMTDCKSMINAFELGGDFHSRTAMGMFSYIRDAVDKGDVVLEWDYEKSGPKPANVKQVKDEYGSERRKAKTLNFSIAYGKTAHGLSKDWGVSVSEAEDMLKAWYNDRPEVLKWQENTKKIAKDKGYSRTLMGRYRDLPDALNRQGGFSVYKSIDHALRASINTPIQGGAADVAMCAMIKINTDKRLKELGWILLLQIHDEVILEGPEETSEEAIGIVFDLMMNPWGMGLEKTKVELLVDGSVGQTWYEAK